MATDPASPRVPGDCKSCALKPLVFYTTGTAEEALGLGKLRRGSRVLPARATIYREGEVATEFHSLFEGWAFRYKLIADGRRQILAFLLPGDSISFQLMRSDRLRFSVQALTEVSLCVFEREALSRYVAERPALTSRLDHLAAREIAIADDRLTDLGQRSAHERVASLILQLHLRLQQRNLADGDSFMSPLRQQHIGDALGLTSVHVSRVLKDLKTEGLIGVERERLILRDQPMLRKLSGLGDRGLDEQLH